MLMLYLIMKIPYLTYSGHLNQPFLTINLKCVKCVSAEETEDITKSIKK